MTKTIYLTDDDEDDRMLIRMAIERTVENAKTVELDCGEALIAALDNEKPQPGTCVVVMDMNMPRMNGLETLKLLKSRESSKTLPIVMLSTTSRRDLVRIAYESGVNAFLEKPVLDDEFLHFAEALDVCFLNSSPRTNAPIVLKKPHGSIIVIEDNDDHLYFIRRALQEFSGDIRIVAFKDGRTALETLRNTWDQLVPKLILIDLYLPLRSTGLDLLVEMHQLLKTNHCQSVPMVVFSSSNNPDDIRASYLHHADAFLTKDTDATTWKDTLGNVQRFWWNTVSHL